MIRIILAIMGVFLGIVVQVTYDAFSEPVTKDNNLIVELYAKGLKLPTGFVFIDNNTILALEKNGEVKLISNGIIRNESILTLPVVSKDENGLLGITVHNPSHHSLNYSSAEKQVLLFYTDASAIEIKNDRQYPKNRIYKYDWDGQNLLNKTLILDLPARPVPWHNGGKLTIGPDGYLYTIIGDKQRDGKLQNFADGPDPDNTGAIFKVDPGDGSPPLSDNALSFVKPGSSENELSKYYAYGIRNGFGLAFDPITGNLWDTENGPTQYDEVNIVHPGFNSGWQKLMGPESASRYDIEDLVNFTGSKYSDPVLSWREAVGLTDIEFLNSSRLGENYTNNVFVGDFNNGNLYFFGLNDDRNAFLFENDSLSDLVVDKDEINAVAFATGFGGITDLETGPDGLLYVLSYGDGRIYRIRQLDS